MTVCVWFKNIIERFYEKFLEGETLTAEISLTETLQTKTLISTLVPLEIMYEIKINYVERNLYECFFIFLYCEGRMR